MYDFRGNQRNQYHPRILSEIYDVRFMMYDFRDNLCYTYHPRINHILYMVMLLTCLLFYLPIFTDIYILCHTE